MAMQKPKLVAPMPNIMAQLQKQTGLGRPGGAASMASKPAIAPDTGSRMAAMQNAMLKKMKPTAVGAVKARQFKKGQGANYGQQ